MRVLAARACIALQDAEGARLELQCATEVFARLGAAPDLAAVKRQADSLDGRVADSSAVSAHGLTARELLVPRLVATSKTNKKIARELSLSYQRPRIREFAGALSDTIRQLHSSEYRNLSQLRPGGGVLLVGAGNSGADLGLEAARSGLDTWLAGQSPGEVPFSSRRFLWAQPASAASHRICLSSPADGRDCPWPQGPAERTARRCAADSRQVPGSRSRRCTTCTPRDRCARWPAAARRRSSGGRPNVIWCTGFDPGFDWIDLPVFAEDGEPQHRSGLVDGQPGLYFVGLHFLHALSSGMVHGVGRDAARIVEAIKLRASLQPKQRRVWSAA